MMAELVARTKALGPPRLSAAAVGQLAWACARLEVRDPAHGAATLPNHRDRQGHRPLPRSCSEMIILMTSRET